MIRWLLLPLFTLVFAQVSAHAAVDMWDYSRDDQTELTLTAEEDGITFEFRAYGKTAQGRLIYDMGTLQKTGPDRYRYTREKPETVTVELVGAPGAATLQINTRGIGSVGETPMDLGGKYELLTAAQRLQRARNRFEKADALLNANYQALRKELDPAAQITLRDSQRDWIASRDSRAEFEGRRSDDRKASPDYWEEMLSQTTTRLEFLRVYTGKGIPPGLSGEYRDFDGGTLSVQETPKGIRFAIIVVRGPTLHTGEISGDAKSKGTKSFYYKEHLSKERRSEGDQPAELTFLRVTDKRIQVDGKNTGHFHGARAYFDGLYFKTGALKAPIDLENF